MARNDGYSGFLVLRLACVCFCLLFLLSLTPAFRPARSHGHLRDLVCLLNAVLFALGFYGIQQRARLTWPLGWFVGGILFSEWLGFCLASTLRMPKPERWIAAASFAVPAFAVALYWGYWWKRHKSYFIPD